MWTTRSGDLDLGPDHDQDLGLDWVRFVVVVVGERELGWRELSARVPGEIARGGKGASWDGAVG